MKPFWIVIITVIVTGGIIGGGGYYYLNRKHVKEKNDLQSQIDDLNAKISAAQTALSTTSTSTTSTTADATAGWKTYTNPTYGFTIEYPSEYIANEIGSFSANDGVAIDSSTTGGYEQPHLISVEAEQSALSIDDYVSKAAKDGAFGSAAKITFAGQTAYEGNDQGMQILYGILVKKGSYVYHFVLDSGNKETLAQNKAGLTTIQNSILSTFQFTK